MDLTEIVFPLYKLRSYINIEKTPLGLIKVTTIKGEYILDDTSIKSPFDQRRLQLISKYPKEKIYKLKEKVLYLRQLVKYRTGTTFIDYNGTIIKYRKSSSLFTITSHKIINRRAYGNWTIINVDKVEIPFLIGETLTPTATHASIMHTKWGPFLYDITSKAHEPYKRKI
jgi:hypothetical protein